MITVKRFSQTKILGTNNQNLGFIRGRKYDTDLDRLGRMETSQRELTRLGDLRTELRKMNSELNRGGRIGKWQDID